MTRAIAQIANDLAVALKRETADVIAIGHLLIEARDAVNHGGWLPWLAANFGESETTAANYMNAARFASKYPTVGDLKLRPTTLYLLGSKSFSPEAIEAILRAAKTERVTPARARAIAQIDEREVEDILDGEPPNLPPLPSVSNAMFDEAVEMLARIQTKPLASFVGTTHAPDRIAGVVGFLEAVIGAMTKRVAA